MKPAARTRLLRIVAQDPEVTKSGRILTTQVEIPAEQLQPGPRGFRVQVIDYDSSTQTLYQAFALNLTDPYTKPEAAAATWREILEITLRCCLS